MLALAAACSSAGGHAASPAALDGQRTTFGSIVLDGSPGTPAVNARTGTLYVPLQCPDSFCRSGQPAHVLDVINAATCNAKVRSGCKAVARATVGVSPNAAVVDEATDTIYVTNSVTDGNDGTVSVVDGARCNARVTAGCGKPRATIKLGGFVVAAALNPATHTLYVADLKGAVDAIDVAACNAATTRSHRHRLRGQQRLGRRQHRVGDRRVHLQRDARQWLRPGSAYHHGGQRGRLGRCRPGQSRRLRHRRQRRDGLGHQRCPLQRAGQFGLRPHLAGGDHRGGARIRSG
jgi:DNA-binding beta-propeller fold protein YncE